MRDDLFLIGWGLAMLAGAVVYAVSGWPLPVLIDKTGA